ncbi:hypothetical protein MOX02_57200 [Methylobacterium oxalidis]|uniref:Insertion element IS150 protein InsJ-like helix-turn-helix domain-containing protein n=1 Tax=Methylobacterium oxalidis TaxID=944322 RepID=A0A512JCK6_9HYPH|nr:hypothetical protein MOX02_57200 [Methylobacterium oxalidis]GJE35430.1 hypothetical protein LDDCCGHA_5648 [Methylobacterium oxalidis]GLS64572.1 hypothetical protein GCM10007888_29530 [Methylobacterium oxalidis]
MRRGQRPSAEQVVLTLRQIEVQTAQGKSIAVACKEAGICEQSYYRWRKEYGHPRPSASRIWPSAYPWPLPCSSLAPGSVQNAGQVTSASKCRSAR